MHEKGIVMNTSHFPKPDVKIFAAGAVLLCCLAGAYTSYYSLYEKTPDYSFAQIRQSLQNGESAPDQPIDIETLAGQLFDALAAQSEAGGEGQSFRRLVMLPQREAFIAAASALWRQDPETDVAEAAAQFEDLSAKSGVFIPASGWHYESASWSSAVGDGYAKIKITAYNDVLGASVPWTFVLERVSARSWRIAALTDIPETLQALQDGKDRALAEQNNDVQKQFDELITIKDVSASLVTDPATRQTYLRVRYLPELTAKGRRELASAEGAYELRKGSSSSYTAPLRIAPSTGQFQTSQFPLNPNIAAQQAVIDLGTLEQTQSRLYITSITKKDGSVLSLATDLQQK